MANNVYKVIKDGSRYTIGTYMDADTVIVNDGICGYYWFDTKAAAQAAADAYNEYDGAGNYLHEHGYGNDIISRYECEDEDLLWLYSQFGAVDVCLSSAEDAIFWAASQSILRPATWQDASGAVISGQDLVEKLGAEEELCGRVDGLRYYVGDNGDIGLTADNAETVTWIYFAQRRAA